jgi:hypothetical protein
MSFKLMGAVCDADNEQIARGLDAGARYVLLRLANRFNPDHPERCFPSHGQLAKDTGVCRGK